MTDDLDNLLRDVAFEAQTRSARLGLHGRAESGDEEHAEPLEDETAEISRIMVAALSKLSAVNEEIGFSLGFDASILLRVVERLVEQERELDSLREAVADLRRRP